MPFFKTTKNILTTPWEDELWDDNWMDSNKLVLPPKSDWDYRREMQIEDVSIWEVLYQQGGGIGIYAAWDPYAEFYLITQQHFTVKTNAIETYYGADAQKEVKKRAKELGVKLQNHTIWVEPEDMWLHQKPEAKANTLILP